jgi:hypothetical protein
MKKTKRRLCKTCRRSKKTQSKRGHSKRRYSNGGMLRTVATRITGGIEPHVQRKITEIEKNIVEDRIKKSNIYKNTENTLNTALNEFINDENAPPNIRPGIRPVTNVYSSISTPITMQLNKQKMYI